MWFAEKESGTGACGAAARTEQGGRTVVIKTIFMDLDDTILDFQTAEAAALSRALRETGLEPTPETVRRYHAINASQWELLEQGVLTREQIEVRRFELLFDELGVERSARAVCDRYEGYLAQGHWFIPGAEALLEELAPRYTLCLASNGAPQVQYSRIESAGIARYFKKIFISQELGADKPSIRFFEGCFAALPDFTRETALIVGDSLTSDIQGGIRAGLHTCWFNFRNLPPRPEIRPEYTIHALAELPPLLEEM